MADVAASSPLSKNYKCLKTMVIKNKKKIRSLNPYIKMIPSGNRLVVGTVNPPDKKLRRAGFSSSPIIGESVLPSPIGKISTYNAEGKEIIHKDQPMETAYRTREWSWTEWHGPYRVEKTDWVDVPYQRYPRSHVAPPSVELTLVLDVDGNKVVKTPVITNWRNNKEAVVHAANILLELFGEFSFYDASMKQLISAPIKKLNWHVLPPGEHPFQELKKVLNVVLSKVKGGNRAFTEHRLEAVNKYKPEFTAVGRGGFSGYVIFGFKKPEIYVLESILYGNATYVLGDKWEDISKKTKAEILSEKLHKKRLIHHKGWGDDLDDLFH